MGAYARRTKSSPTGVKQPLKSDTPGRGFHKTTQERMYDDRNFAKKVARGKTFGQRSVTWPKWWGKGDT